MPAMKAHFMNPSFAEDGDAVRCPDSKQACPQEAVLECSNDSATFLPASVTSS